MNMSSVSKISFHNALIIIILAAGLGLGIGATDAVSADASAPEAHSNGLIAAVSDTVITAKVKAKLMGDDSLKKSDIDVTTTNGVVTLDGSASSSDAKSIAEAAAMSVEGVKSVDNNLKTPTSNATFEKAKRAMSDSWITAKVKTRIFADNVGKGFKVSVKTVHGVVVLKGTLANQDAIDHVKDVAGKVDGVKSVDTSALNIAGN